MYKIYTLTDPITLQIRYVGITKGLLSSRLAKHMNNAKYKTGNYRLHWLKQLKVLNLRPIIEVLDISDDFNESRSLEKYWISQIKAWGFNLTNSTNGGEGSNGYKHSKETLLKMKLISDYKKEIRLLNIVKKVILSKDEQYELLAKKLSIAIIQYNIDGMIIKEWESAQKAAKYYNIRPSAIGHALRDYTRCCINCFWRYKNDNTGTTINVKIKKGFRKKIIAEYLSGEIIQFKSHTEAKIKLKITQYTFNKYIDSDILINNLFKIKNNEN